MTSAKLTDIRADVPVFAFLRMILVLSCVVGGLEYDKASSHGQLIARHQSKLHLICLLAHAAG